jgi:hypothetical protein
MTIAMEIHVKHQKFDLPNKGDVGPMLDMENVAKVLEKTNAIPMEVFIINNLVNGNTDVCQGNKERQDKEVCNEDRQNKEVCNQARQNKEVCDEARQKKWYVIMVP